MTAAELLERLRAELGVDVLAALGYGLSLMPGPNPLVHLGQALRYEAANSDADSSDRLTELATRFALRRIRSFGGEDLLAKLEAADRPPWSWVFEAIMAVEGGGGDSLEPWDEYEETPARFREKNGRP